MENNSQDSLLNELWDSVTPKTPEALEQKRLGEIFDLVDEEQNNEQNNEQNRL